MLGMRRILAATVLAAASLGMLALPAAATPPIDNHGCPPNFSVVGPVSNAADRNGDGFVCASTTTRAVIDNDIPS